jgi:cobalt/nickel transport system permease protein
MDTLACGGSPVHSLDSRAKLFTTLFFILTVVSFDRYAFSALLPFVIYPVFLITAGGLPVFWLLKKIIYVAPFAFMVAVFNPLLDREIIMHLSGTGISGGWISFMSIMTRFVLTVSAALAMIATTGFQSVCFAMNRMGMPRMFAVQLLFLYRYLFVLAEEALRMTRARTLRSSGRKPGLTGFAVMAGNILLRTISRAQRIHLAMTCRGFDGQIRIMDRESFGWKDLLFVIFWCGLFILFRIRNIPEMLGTLLNGGLS